MTSDQITQAIQAFLTLAVVAYLVYKNVTSGGAEITKVTMTAYKERNKQLDDDIKDLKDKYIVQGKEIAHLMGVLQEKDKTIIDLKQTIENRNPDLEKLLAAIKVGQESVAAYMKESIDQSKKVTEVLQNHTGILASIKTRNEQIDAAHISALTVK